jgi:Tfp pilus assembly protein PilF
MRFTPAATALAVLLAVTASVGTTKPPEVQINPASQSWLAKGRAALKAGDRAAARDALETALAADPRNRPAYLLLAQIARADGLPGKAIALYDKALLLDPDDVGALGEQGVAMLDKGALQMAKTNLARIKAVCKGDCPASRQLAEAIGRGVPARKLTAQDVTPQPADGAGGKP